MNPYHGLVAQYERLARESKCYSKGKFPPAFRPDLPPDAPQALFFAPHPDDETIIGGLALRLMREARIKVINVAVTQGSKKERQDERLSELRNACDYIGFELITTGAHGLDRVNPQTRERDPNHWQNCVTIISDILESNKPRVIFFPHEHDWNSTHVGTHFLVIDALARLPAEFECFVVETEYWGQMAQPNLMVEISQSDLADLICATTFHVGEVNRNPFHLLMPAWMMDNVRRGSELVGGQGEAAPNFTFAALYRLRRWQKGQLSEVLAHGRNLPATVNAGELFR
jgi:LmbE family N-acetylglucosaminyl deacetylase